MIICALFIGLIAFSVYSAFFIYLFRSANSRVEKRIVFGIWISPFLAIVVFGSLQYKPTYVYSQYFGQASKDVVVYEGYRSKYFDSGEAYLKFKAPKEILKNILEENNFKEIDQQTYKIKIRPSNRNPPRWWTPALTTNTKIYSCEPFKQEGFTTFSLGLIIYDTNSGLTYFSFHGVD